MKRIITLLSFLVVLAITLSYASPGESAETYDFEVISSTGGDVYANAISSDGNYITGQIGEYGAYMFYWTKDGGINEWDAENTNQAGDGGIGRAVSPTGRIAGFSTDHDITAPIEISFDNIVTIPVQTASYNNIGEETWTVLPGKNTAPLTYGLGIRAYDITDDGNRIVGAQTPGSEAQRNWAGYWDLSDPDNITFVDLYPDLGAGMGPGSEALSVSGDGSVIGGWYAPDWGQIPILWIDKEITTLKGVDGSGLVHGISNNGKYAALQSNEKAMMYQIDKERAYEIYTGQSAAMAVSDNGVVVGYTGTAPTYFNPVDTREAFIYTQTMGMKKMDAFLTEYGVEFPSGFKFMVARDISADGKKIVGFGTLNGSTVGFYVEIPEIEDSGLYAVEVINIESPAVGAVKITWEAPDTTTKELTGYSLYQNNAPIETFDATVTSHTISGLSFGTYSYYIIALYGDEQSAPSEIVSITLSDKRSIPFMEEFTGTMLTTIASLGWEVSDPDRWYIVEGGVGFPYGNAQFLSPSSGEYSHYITSPFIDASETADLTLLFNYALLGSSSNEFMKVEIYDGEQWYQLANMAATNPQDYFSVLKYDASVAAGKDNVRIRFVCHGVSAGSDVQWNIDNVELTDSENGLKLEAPAAIAAFADTEDNTVTITWTDPRENAKLRYLPTEEWTASVVGNEGVPFIAANMYPAELLTLYEGYKLTSISFMPASTMGATYKWFIYQDGQRLYEAPVTQFINPYVKEWITEKLTTPVAFDAAKPLYYGVEVVDHAASDSPLATSDIFKLTEDKYSWDSVNVADGKANIYSEDGGQTWQTLPSYYHEDEFGYGGDVYPVFCIHATIAKNPDIAPKERLNGYMVLRDGVNIFREEYNEAYGTLTPLTTFIDTNPVLGRESCYEVYVYYNIQEFSDEAAEVCITYGEVNIPEIAAKGIKVSRADDYFVIEYPANAGTMTLYNVSGQQLRSYNLDTTGRFVMPSSDLSAGVYVLRFNEINIATKIIKQ